MRRSEMRLGDVWRSRHGRTWLVTRQDIGGTYAAVLHAGDGAVADAPWPAGSEVCLSADRVAAGDWDLIAELPT